jgi:hypothetical protein
MSDNPQYKTEDGSALRIWRDPAKNNFLSERHGRAIFDECIFVEVIAPGSKGSTPVFEVERVFAPELDHPPIRGIQYEQFSRQIDAFKANIEGDASMTGTPLKEWPEISRTMAASLHEARVYSVEGLAGLPDEKLTIIGPDGRTWREKAKAYLAAAKDSAFATSIAAELERIRSDNADKDRQIAELAAQVAALSARRSDAVAESADEAAESARQASLSALGAVKPVKSAKSTGGVVPAGSTLPPIV